MASAISSKLRTLFIASLATLSLFSFDALRAQEAAPLPDYVIKEFGKPPAVPEGPLSKELQSAVKVVFIDSVTAIVLGERADDRSGRNRRGQKILELPGLSADLMRFVPGRQLNAILANTAFKLLGIKSANENHWGVVADHLIAWDIPAPPDYLRAKRAIFTGFVPGWDKIFVEGNIDWRHVSWGGVLIDDRKYDTTDDSCNCIPAADNPKVSSARRRDVA